MAREIRAPHPLAERLPELGLQRPERDVAVGALIRPVAVVAAGQAEVAPARRPSRGKRLGREHRQPRERAVEHRAVHQLALARPLTLAQRDEDPHRRHQGPAAEVGDLAGGLDRWAAGLAGQPQQPVEAEVVHVVARAVAVGAVLPVAGDGAVDQARVLEAQTLIADSQALQHPGAEGLQQHVGVADEAQEGVASPVGLEVEADRALAAVQRQKQRALGRVGGALVVGRRPADVVAHPGVLHLDDVGAEVGEHQRTEPARQQPAEIQDGQALKRQAHGP